MTRINDSIYRATKPPSVIPDSFPTILPYHSHLNYPRVRLIYYSLIYSPHPCDHFGGC